MIKKEDVIEFLYNARTITVINNETQKATFHDDAVIATWNIEGEFVVLDSSNCVLAIASDGKTVSHQIWYEK